MTTIDGWIVWERLPSVRVRERPDLMLRFRLEMRMPSGAWQDIAGYQRLDQALAEADRLAPSSVGCDHCCGNESDHERGCPAGPDDELTRLRDKVAALQGEIDRLRDALGAIAAPLAIDVDSHAAAVRLARRVLAQPEASNDREP